MKCLVNQHDHSLDSNLTHPQHAQNPTLNLMHSTASFLYLESTSFYHLTNYAGSAFLFSQSQSRAWLNELIITKYVKKCKSLTVILYLLNTIASSQINVSCVFSHSISTVCLPHSFKTPIPILINNSNGIPTSVSAFTSRSSRCILEAAIVAMR